jgi:DNA ligase-1
MRRFARLYAELDASTATTAKVEALRRYFAEAPAADAAWALYFLSGGKPRQVVPTAVLRVLACRTAGIDDWLFDACYQAAGDLAETIALVLPAATAADDRGLAYWVEERLLTLRGSAPDEQAARIAQAWRELDADGRFLLTKLIGGGFRVGVSKLLVQRALAEHAGLDPQQVAQRLMGYTDARALPSAERFAQVLAQGEGAPRDAGQPYPFFLAHALAPGPTESVAAALGPLADWLVEWKYDGIRAQVVKRAGQVWIWSRGEELMTERFPEVVAQAQRWPDGSVLDGELLVWPEGSETTAGPDSFNKLQQRIARKTLSRKLLAEVPVSLVAYDLLEDAGIDLRVLPQAERRARLEAFATAIAACGARLRLSPEVAAPDWAALAELRAGSRERGVEGLMLKHRAARYGSGRRQQDGLAAGTWWKWKIEPLTVDCVLIYAQAGHGRRAGVYTDYSFAVWSRPPADADEAQAVVEAIARREPAEAGALQLLPFAKAYSGLTDAEFARVDRVIRATTLEKFGPVRSVRPSLVFELAFEGIARSPRHKSGIAVRFPRMLRIRDDKPLHEADSLATLETLLATPGFHRAP